MNKIDCVITKIITEPHHFIDEEFCTWKVTCEVDCYGHKFIKDFFSHSKNGISKYKKGYSYTE